MKKLDERKKRHYQRHKRIRRKVIGTSRKPRLTIFRSLKHIYVHLVDDGLGCPIMGVSSLDKTVVDAAKGGKGQIPIAKAVGLKLAEKAKEKGIETVTGV